MRPRVPRVPRPLARRIDRLARMAHRFHRFAHHPLCTAYQHELVPLGRRARVCKGCAYAALGLLGGGLTALAVQPPPLVAALAAAVAVGLLVLSFVLRPPKEVTRLAPAGLLGFSGMAGLLAWSLSGLGVAVVAGLVVGALTLFYRRRGPHRAPCETCPERAQKPTCSGFQPILRREAAFRRLSSRWLRAAGL